jgi:hypothetical protein
MKHLILTAKINGNIALAENVSGKNFQSDKNIYLALFCKLTRKETMQLERRAGCLV